MANGDLIEVDADALRDDAREWARQGDALRSLVPVLPSVPDSGSDVPPDENLVIGAVNAVTEALTSLVGQAAEEFDEMSRALMAAAQEYEANEEELVDGLITDDLRPGTSLPEAEVHLLEPII